MSEDVFNLTQSRRPALKLEADLMHRHVQGGRLLDVGCSVGALFEFFPPFAWERYGVELSPSAAEYAAQTYSCSVHTGTLISAQYPRDYFDLMTVIDTLYYLDDPLAELQEIHRLLKPGGYLAVEIAGQAYMLRRNYGLIPWLLDRRWSRASTDSSYLYWFGPEGLRRLLEKCGFEAVAWYVVPSPRRSNPLINGLIGLHFGLMTILARFSHKALSWAPKYLCLAQKREL